MILSYEKSMEAAKYWIDDTFKTLTSSDKAFDKFETDKHSLYFEYLHRSNDKPRLIASINFDAKDAFIEDNGPRASRRTFSNAEDFIDALRGYFPVVKTWNDAEEYATRNDVKIIAIEKAIADFNLLEISLPTSSYHHLYLSAFAGICYIDLAFVIEDTVKIDVTLKMYDATRKSRSYESDIDDKAEFNHNLDQIAKLVTQVFEEHKSVADTDLMRDLLDDIERIKQK